MRGYFSVPTWEDSMAWGSGLGLSKVLGFGSNGLRVQNNQNTQAEYSRSPAALRPQFHWTPSKSQAHWWCVRNI